MRSGLPSASATTRPLAATQRTSPLGHATRNSDAKSARRARASVASARTRATSSGWTRSISSAASGPASPGAKPKISSTRGERTHRPVARLRSASPMRAASMASRKARSRSSARSSAAAKASLTDCTSLMAEGRGVSRPLGPSALASSASARIGCVRRRPKRKASDVRRTASANASHPSIRSEP